MSTRAPSVVVVGAGLAGVVAAWRLVRRGFSVALLEREARAGGALAGEWREGFAIDPWPVPFTDGDRALLAFVAETGLRDEWLPLRPVRTQIAGSERRLDLRGRASLRRIPGIRGLEALRVLRLPRLLSRYADRVDADWPAARLDDRSLADFARLYFGSSVLDRWMGPSALRGAPGDPHEMSRVQFLLDFQRHGFQHPGLARTGLGEVVERAAGELPLRVDCPVRGLKLRKDGCLSVSLERRALRADAVVLATDAAEALRIAEPLLSAAERDFLSGVRYLPCVAVAAALCRPLDSRPREIWVPRSAGSPLQTLLVEPGIASGRVPKGRGFAWLRATPAFAGSVLDVPDSAVEKELLAAFDEIWPGAQRSVDFSHFFRTQRGAPRFGVGHYRALSRFARVRRDRRAAGSRVYFAGDQLVHPSYEGAVLSAERVADAVCEDLLP